MEQVMELEWMKNKFLIAAKPYCHYKDQAEEKWEYLVNQYSSEYRYYHNLNHLWEMFQLYPDINNSACNLAIFYHDFVYRPGYDKNEINSAEALIMDFPHMPYIDGNYAKQYILDTKEHFSDDYLGQKIIDMDLYGFASNVEKFDDNTRKIRLEFKKVSDKDFYEGRLKFLVKYYSRKPFFYTLSEEDDKKAYKNILREIKQCTEKLNQIHS